jgi:hypothetical protein
MINKLKYSLGYTFGLLLGLLMALIYILYKTLLFFIPRFISTPVLFFKTSCGKDYFIVRDKYVGSLESKDILGDGMLKHFHLFGFKLFLRVVKDNK